jgi:hypothetical protein
MPVRRLAQHAVAGVGFSAVVVAAGVVGLGSPAADQPAIAVPGPVFSAPADPVPPAAQTSPDPVEQQIAQRVAAADAASREAERALLAATNHAAKRGKALSKQSKRLAKEQKKLKAAAEAAAKKAAEEKAALERALKNRGYLPGTTDPREIARQIMKNKYGYGAGDFDCLNNIIMGESRWRINATNPRSGAYGIPQALPGSKMASAGADWRTNPATQIIWAIGYMEQRYGTPCKAWSFKRSHGWY